MKAPENFPWSRMGSIAAGAVLAAAFAYAPVTANAEEAASKALAGQGQETQVVATESVAQASPSGQAVGPEGAAADSDGTTDHQSTSTEPSDQETAEFAADAAEVDGSATGATESEISSTADATASNGNDAGSTAGGSSDEAKSSGTSAAEATTGGADGETGASDVGTSTADGDASNAGASSSPTVTDGTASDTPAADAGTASDETATDSADAAGGSTATTAPAARVAADDTSNLQNMYRFYNPNTGEHFYTANTYEGQALVTAGWQYEGVGWVALKSGTAVYRLYNPNAGDHHYTTNAAERDMLVALGWRYEGVGWYSATKSAGLSVYREYNPNAKSGAHNFTTSSAENANLVKAGWRYEGIAWYASTHASLAFDKSLFQVILNGIDIASYQKDMDISKVTADFVIVKATQGTHYKNPYFSTQAETTLSSGKKLGVYHFIDVSSGDGSMVQQAQYFVNAVKSYIGQAVLVLDWENTPGSEALRKGPSYAKQFLDEVYRLTGVRALIYMSQGVTSTYDWSSVAASGYKLWVASYPHKYMNGTGYVSNPTPISTNYGAWSSPTIWQYSDSTKVGGYSNGVDVDAFYGTTAYWDSLARKS
jgi:GH25 family lysozyme M1 (1,4-beta-N-acetylmuramidase)